LRSKFGLGSSFEELNYACLDGSFLKKRAGLYSNLFWPIDFCHKLQNFQEIAYKVLLLHFCQIKNLKFFSVPINYLSKIDVFFPFFFRFKLGLHFVKKLILLRSTHHLNDHYLSVHRINMAACNFLDISFDGKTRLDNSLELR
jgi:hypothetical protein